MKASIDARYSTELQREASIEDQVRVCTRLIEDRGWTVGRVYSDYGQSGSSHLRSGYQALLEGARDGSFDTVVAEGLDRLSRDQEHIAAFYKQMSFQGIQVVTVTEGAITELHVGLKGTMSALFLKDLAQKTHRGLEGRVRQGKSAGGVSFGYKAERHPQPDGTFTTGDRSIVEDEARVVERVFQDYVFGRSPRKIAADLNREGIRSPGKTGWGASTIYGNWRRGTGILNNELYIGRMVWNRQRFIKDPLTGKRQARMNPPEEWIIEEVPELRIISDDLWAAVKSRQEGVRSKMGTVDSKRIDRARRPKYLFSGLMKCGGCGGGYVLVGKSRYGCANTRNKGTCENRRTIERSVLEARVFSGLKEHLLSPDLIADFIEEYRREYNRLMKEEFAARTAAERELVKVQKRIDDIVEAICEGMFHPSMKEKMTVLEDRKAELAAQLEESEEEPLRLHPGLSDIYKEKVQNLTDALNEKDTRQQAGELLRSLLTEIRLLPQGDGLDIELVGELAAIMGLSEKEDPRSVTHGGSTLMVAGAGFEPATFRL